MRIRVFFFLSAVVFAAINCLPMQKAEAQSASAETWEWIIKPQYDGAYCFSEGYAAVEVGDKYGFIDMNGKWIVKPKFEYAMGFENGYATVNFDDNWGIIDKKGKWVVKPKFMYVWSNSEDGFEVVDDKYRWGLMDKKGKYIIKPDNISCNFDEGVYFSEGLAAAYCTDEKYSCRGYIDENGKWVIEPQFFMATPFNDGRAWVYISDTGWGVIDTTGKWVVKPQYEFDHYVLGFSEGLSPVAIDGKEGYMDRDGNIVIEPQFDLAGPFENGKAWFLNREDWGFVDKDGNIIFSLKHDDANAESEDDLVVVFEPMNGVPIFNITFSEGLAVYKQEGKKGYINEKGEWVIPPQFDNASYFMDGVAMVSVGGKWGVVDNKGSWVVEPMFDKIFCSYNGLMGVSVGDKWGFIDIKGNWVVKPMYDDVEPLKEGILAVEVDGKWGVVDRNFKYLAEPQFDGIFCNEEGVVAVSLNGKWGYIRLK